MARAFVRVIASAQGDAAEANAMKAKLKIKRKKRVVAIPNKTFTREKNPEADFTGPNVRKRHRKADEVYGDTSIPDAARRE